MNALECKAYLERIGYQEEPHTDKDCLEKLMELQRQSVPFENLEVFKEKRVPSLKTEDIFHKIVHQERGGYCFELNKIFYELLKGLGFDVTPLAIRMLWSPDDFRRTVRFPEQGAAGTAAENSFTRTGKIQVDGAYPVFPKPQSCFSQRVRVIPQQLDGQGDSGIKIMPQMSFQRLG